MGMGLGIWLHGRVDQAPFQRIAYGFVAIAEAKLIRDGSGGG